MAKVGARDYYNLLISRINRLINEQINSYHDQPITPEMNINFITGTNRGLKLVCDLIQDLEKQLSKGDLIFKEKGYTVELIEGEKNIPMPHEIRKNFNYD